MVFLYNTNSKIDVINELMYKYVDFYRGIYLECLFLFIFIREGVGICAVLRGTGGGGVKMEDPRIWDNITGYKVVNLTI